MKGHQGPWLCLLFLVPCVLGLPLESESTLSPDNATTLSPVSSETSTLAPVSTAPEITTLTPEQSTLAPPGLTNATTVEGNNSTTVIGNNTIVVGNNTIVVSQPGSQITVTILPGGGVAINMTRPGQNISITPDRTIITREDNVTKSVEVIDTSNKPMVIPVLSLPLFHNSRHRERLPFGSFSGPQRLPPYMLNRDENMEMTDIPLESNTDY